MAAKGKKRRSRISQDRIDKVLAALPAAEVQRIRHSLQQPRAPKRGRGRPPVSLTGKRFGKWTVGPRAAKPGRVFYTCLCDCGNLGTVDASLLRRGQSRQCRECADRGVSKNLPRVRASRP